jgi:hypothetical protein
MSALTALDDAVGDAWQRALAAEQRAVFGYGLLGPHLSGADETALARRCQAEHETVEDHTAAAMSDVGRTPAAAAVDYPDLYPVSDARSARALAIRLEQEAATAWRFLYAVTASVAQVADREPQAPPAGLRAAAQQALTASAVRGTRWRVAAGTPAPTVAFPGL